MNSARLLVVILIILILAGGISSSVSNNNDRNARAGEPHAYDQGDHAFYEYHKIYNLAELHQYQSNLGTSHYVDQFSEERDTIKNDGVDRNLTENPAHGVSPLFNGGPMDSAWPMASHDVYHSGRSPYNTTVNPDGVEKWRFPCSNYAQGGPILDQNGTIYFGSYDTYFYALYPNGTLKWKTKLYRVIDSTPAIDENGIIYIGTIWAMPNYLFAVYSSNGTVKWSYCTGNHVDSSPAIGTDGTIYFGDWNGYIQALNPNGTLKWRYRTGNVVTGSPVIGSDGIVYIGSQDDNLYAFYPNNGTIKWTFHAGDWIRVSPCIGDDGTVYCVSFDNYLYAIYPNNGTMKWRTFVNAGTNPTVGPDGTIYAGWDILHAVNPVDGSMKWTLVVSGAIEGSTPCTSREGIIYFGTTGGDVFAVNPNGTVRWRRIIGSSQSPPAIDSDGTIYIGSNYDTPEGTSAGFLHAFGHGPLNVEANGPYNGAATVPIQFTGDIFGGTPPYTCLWDFGDNQSSSEQNPKHAYAHYGIFTATFTVTDSQGNHSTDTTNVTVHYAPPTVRFTKPVNGTYFMNVRILPFPGILIFGPITVNVEASQEQFGINRVEFWLDNKIHWATDTDPPYSYTWRSLSFFKHFILVQVFDNSGNYSYAGIYVWKFF